MGKYIRKSKPARELTAMDASQSYIGVRTRAKTLALQRLHKISNSPPLPPSPGTSGSYLQLRSRRLHKPQIIDLPNDSRKPKLAPKTRNGRRRRASSDSRAASRLGICSVSSRRRINSKLNEQSARKTVDGKTENIDSGNICGVGEIGSKEDASCGENVLDFEVRMSRESTPCSLISKPDSIRTPGSSTKASGTTDNRIQRRNSSPTDVPTAREVDDFFDCAEGEHQRQFIKKYNFDPIKDKPLPGRYEWEKLDG